MNIFYVAGNYTATATRTVEQNVAIAREWAAAINRTGLAWALLPHNVSTGIEDSLSEKEWIAFTLELCRRNGDGLFLLPDWAGSDGSVGEWRDVAERKVPWVVGYSLTSVEASVRTLNMEIAERRLALEPTQAEQSAPWRRK